MIQKDYSTKEKIQNRVKEHYDYVTSLNYNVVGIFLQGSQNYGLDYEGSDIDTKAIIMPSYRDIILGTKPVNRVLVLDNDEHIELKDIRLMFEMFRKQNPSYVELLFTEYFVINDEYSEHVNKLVANREAIARFDEVRVVKSMAGMAYEKKKALTHPYPSIKHKIDEFGYDGKQLHHIMRLYEMMHKYVNGESFQNCLKVSDAEYLISIKRDNDLNLDYAIQLAKELTISIDNLRDLYLKSKDFSINEDVNVLLDDILMDIAQAYAIKEFNIK